LKINDLRNDPIVFAQLPKLDVAGSSPVARSQCCCDSKWPPAFCASGATPLIPSNSWLVSAWIVQSCDNSGAAHRTQSRFCNASLPSLRSSLESRDAAITSQLVLDGDAEAIPLENATVSVVTSNGAFNLKLDTRRAVSHLLSAGLDDVKVMSRLDYFAASWSAETRKVAQCFWARAVVIRAREGRAPNATLRVARDDESADDPLPNRCVVELSRSMISWAAFSHNRSRPPSRFACPRAARACAAPDGLQTALPGRHACSSWSGTPRQYRPETDTRVVRVPNRTNPGGSA
jgi:hypothetical protein